MGRELIDRPSRLLTLDGEEIAVRVRESAQARTARILVGPERPLEIIVSRGVSEPEIDDMLESRRRWIAEKVSHARQVAAREPELFLDGRIWLGGGQIDVERRAGARSFAERCNGRLVVHGPEEGVSQAIQRWYRREARDLFAELAEAEASRLGVSYRSLAIRDPRTRWGSCSNGGNLSFSWRLALAPRYVACYVATRELCHLLEPSHSKAFWRLLAAAAPDWRDADSWLKRHGSELRRCRASNDGLEHGQTRAAERA